MFCRLYLVSILLLIYAVLCIASSPQRASIIHLTHLSHPSISSIYLIHIWEQASTFATGAWVKSKHMHLIRASVGAYPSAGGLKKKNTKTSTFRFFRYMRNASRFCHILRTNGTVNMDALWHCGVLRIPSEFTTVTR